MPRYTKCPFYIDESRRTISCEDVARLFDSRKDKCEYMDKYCDEAWQECEYAIAITQAYDKLEKGDKQALEKQKIKALESEIRSNLIKIGRAETKIREQKEQINNLIGSNKKLMDARRTEHDRRMKLEKELAMIQDKVADDIKKIAQLYEDRIAYLMDTFADGTFREADAEAWAKGKQFAVVHEVKQKDRVWKVVIKQDGKDGSKSDKDVQTKEQVPVKEGKH
jgi:hypothetical protein